MPILNKQLFLLTFLLSTFLSNFSCYAHDCRDSSHFHTKDFKGKYIGLIQSTGTTGDTSGISSSGILQVEINKTGDITVNFISQSYYTGGIGTPLINNSTPGGNPPNIQVTFIITDTKNGGGVLTLSDLDADIETIYDFVALKKDGKVETIYASLRSVTPSAFTQNTLLLTLTRQ